MQNKSRDIPTHNKHANCKTNYRRAQHIYFTKVFRSKKKRVGTKRMHEVTCYRSAKNIPEDQQYLVTSEMQQEQLHRQGMPKTNQVFFHIQQDSE